MLKQLQFEFRHRLTVSIKTAEKIVNIQTLDH